MTIAKKGYFLALEQNHILGEALIKEPLETRSYFLWQGATFF